MQWTFYRVLAAPKDIGLPISTACARLLILSVQVRLLIVGSSIMHFAGLHGAVPGSLPGPCRELSWGCFRHPGLQILRNFGGRVLAGRNENWEKNLKSGLFSAPRGLQICAGCSENCGTRDLASPSALKKCTGTKRTPRRSRS